jgi:hypothetical protein
MGCILFSIPRTITYGNIGKVRLPLMEDAFLGDSFPSLGPA